jgi:hypothetical protein
MSPLQSSTEEPREERGLREVGAKRSPRPPVRWSADTSAEDSELAAAVAARDPTSVRQDTNSAIETSMATDDACPKNILALVASL